LFLPLTEEPIKYTWAIEEHSQYPYNEDKFISLKYLSEWTNVELEMMPIPSSNYKDKVSIMFASGDLPDIMVVPAKDADSAGSDGLLLPLDDLIGNYVLNLNKRFEERPDFKATIKSADGVTYRMPQFARPRPIYTWVYRKDMLESLGLSVPKTMDDFVEVLRVVKKAYPDMAPYQSRSGKDGKELTKWQAGYDCWVDPDNLVVIEDEKVQFALENPMAKKLVGDVREIFAEGLMNEDYILGNKAVWQERMLTNQGFITMDWHTRAEDFMNKNKKAEKPIEGYVTSRMLPPVPEGGSGNLQEVPEIIQSKTTVFNKDIKNPEIAVQMIDFLYSPQGIELQQ